MRTGANTKYSHTLAETVRVLRSIPQFAHLRGHFFILLDQVCEERETWISKGMKARLGNADYPSGLPYAGGWFGDRDAPNADIEHFNVKEILKRFCVLGLPRCPICKEPRPNLRFFGRGMQFYADHPHCLDCSHQFYRFCNRAGFARAYFARTPEDREAREMAETLWLSHIVATRPKWAMRHKRARG